MKSTNLQFTFENVVSFDGGETFQDVTVGYDYYPEENNYPHEPDSAEVYDVFVFDIAGKDITYDIPEIEYQNLCDEAKIDHAQLVAESNEI